MSQNAFIDDRFKNILFDEVITKVYPKLILDHKQLLLNNLIKVINCLALVYNFYSNRDVFYHELTQNNYQDLKWLSTMLIEYTTSAQEITSFYDFYKLKNKSIKDEELYKEVLPKYIFTNVQYGRLNRGKKNDSSDLREIEFNEEFINHNTNLLISAILESAHKLYVNWMDVLPISYLNYTSTELYENTVNLIKNKELKEINLLNSDEFIYPNLKHFHSIQINDIYNVCRVFLYEEIKSTKLFIYDLIDIKNKELLTGVNFLDKYFGSSFQSIFDNTTWDNIPAETKEYFTAKLSKLFDAALANQIVKLNKINGEISAASIQRLVKAIIVTFDNKNNDNDTIKKSGYKFLRKTIDEEEALDDDKLYDEYSMDNIQKSIKTVKAEFIYEHFRIMIQIFKNTVYGTFTLSLSKTHPVNKSNVVDNFRENHKYEKKDKLIFTQFITLKNIYNFAKSLSRYNKGKDYPAFPKNWKSLEKSEKDEIISRLTGKKTVTNWFNISRYIKYIYGELNLFSTMFAKYDKNDVLLNVHKELYDLFTQYLLVDVIFRSMIVKGILISLKPNKELTDQRLTPRDRGAVWNKIDETQYNKIKRESYSYLSELPYKNSDDPKTNYGEFDIGLYRKNPLRESQIGNENGWFTLYALDWISQIGFCHKFIHQRVSFVTGGTGVGKSTQVPKLYMYYLKALNYNSTGKVACTQPRKAPTKKNADMVSKELGFPIFTYKNKDQKSNYFYVQMHYKGDTHIENSDHLSLKYITDGTLVQEIKDLHPLFKRKKNNGDPEDRNLYDIVIIDEAHEHGKNMDVLLTMLRTYTYLNPEIKLVILSATMDEDEPVYRRYYRDINDNIKSPLDTNLRDLNFDRINIDRRFHISPPGYGTNFPIKEIYRPGGDVYDIVREIIKEGMKGFVLIFQPGEADIVKMVDELNKFIPDDVLALPFYSSLSDDKKSVIEDIDKVWNKIRMSKLDDFKSTNPFVGTNSYSNFIICATNIAEASITIQKLYYVIETGTRKSNIYDYKNRISKLKLLPISESSRLQRKGRVGRTGPGSVYYLYKKGEMENNKILFEFSTNNIADDIFANLIENYGNIITTDRLLDLEQFGYLFNTSNGRYNYFGMPSHSDYDYNNKYFPKLYQDTSESNGYNSDTLYDSDGEFYIVHPEELDIDRNIMGKFIGTKNKSIKINNYKLQSEKIDSFFDDLYLSKFIQKENGKYLATKFGSLFYRLMLKFPFDDQNLNKIMANSILLNNAENAAKIIAILHSFNSTSFDLTNILNPIIKLIPPQNYQLKMYDLDFFKKFFIGSRSDIDTLLRYANEIIDNYNKFNSKEIKLQLDNFESIDKTLSLSSLSPEEYYKILADFDHKQHELVINYRIQEKLSYVNNFISTISQIIKVNPSHIKIFLQFYLKLKDSIQSCFNPSRKNKNLLKDLEKYQNEYEMKYKDYDKNILMFLLAQPFNVAKNIAGTTRFLSVYQPSSENIYSMPVYRQIIGERAIMKEDLGFDAYLAYDYVFFYTINTQKETLSVVIPLSKDYLKLYPEIYSKERLAKISSTEFSKVDKYIKKFSENTLIPEITVRNDVDALSKVKITLDEILRELS